MTGMTYKWRGNNGGPSNPNDIGVVSNWLVQQGGTFVAASSVPGAGDTLLVPAGTIADTGVNFVGNSIQLLGSGSQINATSVTFDLATTISVGTGIGASVLVGSGVGNAGTFAATSAGSALYLKLTDPTGMLNTGLMSVGSGDTFTISDVGTNTGALINTGGTLLTQSGGVFTLNAPVINGGTIVTTGGSITFAGGLTNGGLVSAAGGSISVASVSGSTSSGTLLATAGGSLSAASITSNTVVAQGGTVSLGNAAGAVLEIGGNGRLVVSAADAASAIVFLDSNGTLVTGGTLNAPIYGFGTGDVIDLTAVSYATLGNVIVNGSVVVVGNATLDLLGAGLTSTSFNTAPDGKGGTLLTAPNYVPFIWGSATSGIWSDPSQWRGGVVPGTADLAVIANFGGANFTVSNPGQSVGSIAMFAPTGTLALSGTINVSGPISDLAGSTSFAPGLVLTAATLMEPAGSTVSFTDDTIMLSGSLSANAATISLSGSSLHTASLSGSNAISLSGNSVANIATIATVGSITLNGSTLVSNTLSGGSSISIGAGSIASIATIGTVGSVTVNGGTFVSTALTGVGSISLSSGGNLQATSLSGSTSVSVSGNSIANIVTIGTTGSIVLSGGKLISNALSTTGSVTVSNGGSLQAASLSVSNSITETGGGVVQLGTIVASPGGSITLDGTSSMVLGGSSPIAGSLVISNGTVTLPTIVNVPTLDILGASTHLSAPAGTITANAIVGSGVIDVGHAGGSARLEIDTSAIFNNGINLSGTLILQHASSYVGTVNIDIYTFPFGIRSTGTLATASFDLQDVQYSTALAAWNPRIGISSLGTLVPFTVLPSGLPVETWSIAADANGGTTIGYTASPPASVCYVSGTLIATPGGSIGAEVLQPGDIVWALDNRVWTEQRLCWVGQTIVDLDRHVAPERAAPIRIAAHAFEPDVPHRDLLVSPDHAVLMDGVLMQAQSLVNGSSIRREPPTGKVTYVHLELEKHSMLLAEGLPAESYLDTGNRGWFDNTSGPRPLFPDYAGQKTWNDDACLPLILNGAEVEAAHSWLLHRAIALGHRKTTDPALRVLANGREVTLLPDGDRSWRAILPASTQSIRIVSRNFVPDEADPTANDRRRLGVAVAKLTHCGSPVSQSSFGYGWHEHEESLRWTNGDATVALDPQVGPSILTLTIASAGAIYWHADQATATDKQRQIAHG